MTRDDHSITPEEEWAAACDELTAALAECQRRGCGITDDAALMVGIIARDESLGPASVRHVARMIRRSTHPLTRRAREVEANRVAFWRAQGLDPDNVVASMRAKGGA